MRDAEPGKIVQGGPQRQGGAVRTWHGSYYGTVDATPLYLVPLSEVWRPTRHWYTTSRSGAERARLDRRRAVDLDGDVFAEYLGAAGAVSTTSRGRTLSIYSGSRMGDSRICRSPPARCRDTSTTRSAAWPSLRERSGATVSWPSGSTSGGRGALLPFQRDVLDRGAQWLLRARARRPREQGRLALLEHRAPASSGIVPRNASMRSSTT